MSQKIKLFSLVCKRCGYQWNPRKPEVIACPQCKSPYWNKEYTYNMKKEENKNG